MEEKNTKGNAPEKLTYEQLQKVAGELHQENQKMRKYIGELQQALQESDFNATSFAMQMMFRVVDHLEYYSEDFGKYCVDHIEKALKNFIDSMESAVQAPKEEKKDEAA